MKEEDYYTLLSWPLLRILMVIKLNLLKEIKSSEFKLNKQINKFEKIELSKISFLINWKKYQ